MTLHELVQIAGYQEVRSGWREVPRTPLEIHALIHSEIAEATEEVRVGRHLASIYSEISPGAGDLGPASPMPKPEGEAVELADAVIRIAAYFHARGWDLDKVIEVKMAYNATRSHRHGGKAA